MTAGAKLLRELGVVTDEAAVRPPSSDRTFDDGGHARVEIPSVEGPAALRAVLDEAEGRGVPVHRVSQGSGIALLTDAEIREMVTMGADSATEVCLFVGPRAPWEGTAASLVPDGAMVGWRHTGLDQVRYAYDDVTRAVELGIRSVLLADEGLIWLVDQAKRRGDLPASLVVKASAVMGIVNALGARVLQDLGASTLNISSDTTIPRLYEMRSVLRAPLDLYVESPDSLGGFLRYAEIPELVRVGAPIYLKFGLRNAPAMYPTGGHVAAIAESTGRERVRRAAIGVERLARTAPTARLSPVGQHPGVPEQ